jgi:calcineurin-like phosphoesterase family protein
VFDLIGDVHGYADKLRALLHQLGYEIKGGIYRHPDRQVIFLGDYIDRGPHIGETLQVVRTMVQGGSAIALMGNHEFNAIGYHTRGSDGEPLRSHSKRHNKQHEATLAYFQLFPDEKDEILAWFLSLPLFIDLGDLRAVHATWDDQSIDALGQSRLLSKSVLVEAFTKGHPIGEAVARLLKGRELPLPKGNSYVDKDGFERREIRTKWWLELTDHLTYREAAFPEASAPIDVRLSLMSPLPGYPSNGPPVFCGHYWQAPDDVLRVLSPNVACLDYSVGRGGKLVAYRWSGERTLRSENFVAV